MNAKNRLKKESKDIKKKSFRGFNFGTFLGLAGIFILAFNFLNDLFSGKSKFSFYFLSIGLLILYIGIVIHFVVIGNRPFSRAWVYFKKIKKYAWFGFSIFVFTALIGFLFPYFFQEEIINLIKELAAKTQGLGGFELIRFIIFNNVKSSFFAIFFGFFSGVVPFFISIVNGYVLGFVANKTVLSEGILVLWRLFPHGILEIPAVMISIGLGLRIGMFPFYIKERARGFAAIILSFFIFGILMGFAMFFFSLANSLSIENLNSFNLADSPLMKDSLHAVIFFIFYGLFFIFSIFIGLKILSVNDRKIVIENIINSLLVFVFIVIPLLIVAGIIEGGLIWMLE